MASRVPERWIDGGTDVIELEKARRVIAAFDERPAEHVTLRTVRPRRSSSQGSVAEMIMSETAKPARRIAAGLSQVGVACSMPGRGAMGPPVELRLLTGRLGE